MSERGDSSPSVFQFLVVLSQDARSFTFLSDR